MNNFSDSKCAAKEIRSELGIADSEAVNFGDVLSRLNIRLREVALKDGTLGACKVIGLKRMIVVSTAIVYETQKRFTMAHEIGHIVLHHGTRYCNADDLFEFRSKQDRETEANTFASAFLVPQSIIQKNLKVADISFDMAQKLAAQYNVSLTAILIRLVKECADDVCVFIHSNGKIKYVVKSQNCRLSPQTNLIDPNALANDLSDEKIKIKGDSDCSYWFVGDTLPDDIICTEESWYFRHIKETISIVNVYQDNI